MSKSRRTGLLAMIALTAFAGCLLSGDRGRWTPAHERVHSAESGVIVHRFPIVAAEHTHPEMLVDETGRIHLTWIAQANATQQAFFIVQSDDLGRTFGTPRQPLRTAGGRPFLPPEYRTVSRTLAHKNTIHLAWTSFDENKMRMLVATSIDRGETFGTPLRVHESDGSESFFTSIAVSPHDALLCSWLSRRSLRYNPYSPIRRIGPDPIRFAPAIAAQRESPAPSPCFPTASWIAPDGAVYVVLPDVADGVRRIGVGRMKEARRGYEIFPVVPASPSQSDSVDDRPSLAVVGDVLHLVWTDSHQGSSRCYHAAAKLDDMMFRVSELPAMTSGVQANARLFADNADTLHAVWEERRQYAFPLSCPCATLLALASADDSRTIAYAAMKSGTTTFAPPRIIAEAPNADQANPAISGTPNGPLCVSWIERTENGAAIVATTIQGVRR